MCYHEDFVAEMVRHAILFLERPSPKKQIIFRVNKLIDLINCYQYKSVSSTVVVLDEYEQSLNILLINTNILMCIEVHIRRKKSSKKAPFFSP